MILINRSILYSLIFATALFSTTSCSFNEFQDPSQIVDISKEIDLRLLPVLKSESELQWLITTKENNYCETSELQTVLVNTPARYELLIRGIESPANCGETNFGINSEEKFAIENSANFIVSFPNELTSTINLSRKDNKFSIESSEQDFFSFSQRELVVFDKLTFWAGIKNSSSEVYGKYYFDLLEFAEKYDYQNLNDGDYGFIRKIVGNQSVYHPTTLEKYEDNLTFQISDEVDYNQLILDLETLLFEFHQENPELDIFIATSVGDVISF